MKRLLSLVSALLLALALAVPALADIAYLPDDSFLEKHRQECSYENRAYYTNGDAGYVEAYKNPRSGADGVVPNGEKLWVSWTYDGAWAYGESELFSGWVKLAELTPDYDSDAFLADHKNELVEEERALRPDKDEDGEVVVYAYTYPGSGTVKYAVNRFWDDALSFSTLFTDPAGRTWGWCSYHYGYRDFWVCLDEPCNGELPADENFVDVPAQLTPRAEPAAVEAAAKALRTPKVWLIAGVGGAVVVAAAIGAAAIKRRRKNAADPEN